MNSCHNTERKPTLWVQDGWIQATEGGVTLRVANMVEIDDVMEKPCQYRRHVDDPKCKGCHK